jgi:hypothetical protein
MRVVVLAADGTEREEHQSVGLAGVINIHEFGDKNMCEMGCCYYGYAFISDYSQLSKKFPTARKPERPLPLSYLPEASSIQLKSSLPGL